jgi:hypothetical protein
MATKQIIDKFVSSVDVSVSYSISDLVKLLKEAYKNTKHTDKNGVDKPKKAPSQYNLFIKEQMAILKNDGCNPKERMRKATEEWKRQKGAATPALSDEVASDEVASVASETKENE